MNMTKQNRSELKALRQQDKLAAREQSTIHRNSKKAVATLRRRLKGLSLEIRLVQRAMKSAVAAVAKRRLKMDRRIAILTGRSH